MLLNIGHGAVIAKIGTGFWACCHNKVETNQIFYGDRFVHGGLRWQNGGGENIGLKKKRMSEREENKGLAVTKRRNDLQ